MVILIFLVLFSPASGLYGYGAPIVAAPIATKLIAPAIAPVTSVTARQDIYGAKVIAAPVLAGKFSKKSFPESIFTLNFRETKLVLLFSPIGPAYVAGPAVYGKGLYGGYGLGHGLGYGGVVY